MFNKDQVSVVEWITLFILLAIPIVNVLFIFYILFNKRVSKTITNLLYALLIVLLVFVLLLGSIRSF